MHGNHMLYILRSLWRNAWTLYAIWDFSWFDFVSVAARVVNPLLFQVIITKMFNKVEYLEGKV